MRRLLRSLIPGALLITVVGSGPAAAASLAPAPASPGAASPAGPAVRDCGTGPALIKPSSMILTCADDGELAEHLTWTRWTATRATATGTVTWNVCIPDCAGSRRWDHTSADITLTQPAPEHGNRVLFTRLVLHVTGRTPRGFMRDLAFSEAPVAPVTPRMHRPGGHLPPPAPSGSLGYPEIEGYWIIAGGLSGPDGSYTYPQVAAAITGAESSFLPGNIQPGVDYCGPGGDRAGWGLWQITCGNSVPQYGTDFQVLDPWNNAEEAVYKCVQDMNAGYPCFEPWTTWTNGTYTQYLSHADPDTNIGDPGEYVQYHSTPPGTPSSPPPAPGSTYGPPMPGTAPTAVFGTSLGYLLQEQPVVFNGSASNPGRGGTIASYAWTFGDGATASGAVVSHDFVTSAPVTVTLTITDTNGQRASVPRSWFVLPSDSSASNYISSGVNQEHVFYQTSAGALQQAWWNTTTWNSQPLTGSPHADPVTLNYNGEEHVFDIGSGGAIEQDFWNGTTWVPQTLPGTAAQDSALGGTDYITNIGVLEQHVFFTGSSGGLQQTFWDGAWHNQALPGAPVAGSPIVSSLYVTGGGVLEQHVFFIGAGDTLQQTFWDGAWHNQTLPGKPVAGQNTLATADYVNSNGVLEQHVFFIGAGNTLQQTFWNGSTWVNQPIPGSPVASGGLVTSNFDPGQQHVFIIGAGNTLQQTFWDGAWHNQTLPGTAGRVLAANDYALAGQEQHVFFATPSGGLQQTFWNASAWHNQALPGPAVAP